MARGFFVGEKVSVHKDDMIRTGQIARTMSKYVLVRFPNVSSLYCYKKSEVLHADKKRRRGQNKPTEQTLTRVVTTEQKTFWTGKQTFTAPVKNQVNFTAKPAIATKIPVESYDSYSEWGI